MLILGYGAVAAVCGALLLSRRRVNVAVLGLAAALGTANDHPRHVGGRPHDRHRGQRGALSLGLAGSRSGSSTSVTP